MHQAHPLPRDSSSGSDRLPVFLPRSSPAPPLPLKLPPPLRVLARRARTSRALRSMEARSLLERDHAARWSRSFLFTIGGCSLPLTRWDRRGPC
jgi:hypothetical protein